MAYFLCIKFNQEFDFRIFEKKFNLKEIQNYFPDLTENQTLQFNKIADLYKDWNQKINVVSRKDIDEIYTRHVLHALAIAKINPFLPETEILDVGTGGGFPGIPLAILFPECKFTLVDSIGKKIKVVDEVVEGLGLTNVTTINDRVENIDAQFEFIVSRAVAAMQTFTHWVKGKISSTNRHERRNGILYLKGGDLSEELAAYTNVEVFNLEELFNLSFFETKKLVYLPRKK